MLAKILRSLRLKNKMKKINFRKILIAVLWIIGLSGLIASLAFVSKKEKAVVVQNLLVTVNNTEVNTFIDEEDVKEFFNDRKDSILNTPLQSVDVNSLEKALNSHPAVENADIAVDLNGDVTIDVTQRTPLVRVMNMDGESYYIDNRSKLMPLNDKYTARVIVATGFINEPYATRYMVPVNNISKNEKFATISVLDDIYTISTYIAKDSVLSSLIHQINVTNDKELELYPSIGNHKIVFGEAIDIEEKFNKLKTFYTEGLNKTDGWNKYSTINIKYKNQVVCTKK
jgi:cell division protein FtsQ